MVGQHWFLVWIKYIDLIRTWCHQMDTFSVHDVIKWKHCLGYWPFVQGIHSPVISPHKGQWRGALMFSLICTWINVWVNNEDASDLRRHCAHHGITVMHRSHPYRDSLVEIGLLSYRHNGNSYDAGSDTNHVPLDISYDDVIKWKHFPLNWPCVRGIHRSPVNSQHKG